MAYVIYIQQMNSVTEPFSGAVRRVLLQVGFYAG